MSNGSLEDVLGSRARRKGLDAETRVRIALGVAHALDYLHTPWLDKPAIIHRDVKVIYEAFLTILPLASPQKRFRNGVKLLL